MAKHIPDSILDLMLDVCEGANLHVCSTQPTNGVEATDTYQLATEPITGGNITAAAGDISGRKNTYAPGTGTTIDNTGTAEHIACTDGASPEVLLFVTTCSSQQLTSPGTVDIGSFDHELGDPT